MAIWIHKILINLVQNYYNRVSRIGDSELKVGLEKLKSSLKFYKFDTPSWGRHFKFSYYRILNP